MTRVVVNEEIRKKLLNFSQPLELVNETGLVLAKLTPAYDPSQWEIWEPETSRDELQRILEEPEFSFEEVMEHLKTLENR